MHEMRFSDFTIRAASPGKQIAPPSLETILRRADEVKRGTVKGHTRKELSALWAKDRRKASVVA
jgi:hypothetical protein